MGKQYHTIICLSSLLVYIDNLFHFYIKIVFHTLIIALVGVEEMATAKQVSDDFPCTNLSLRVKSPEEQETKPNE